jgi:hypothetical protein
MGRKPAGDGTDDCERDGRCNQGHGIARLEADSSVATNRDAVPSGLLGDPGAASVRVWEVMSRGRRITKGGDRRPRVLLLPSLKRIQAARVDFGGAGLHLETVARDIRLR